MLDKQSGAFKSTLASLHADKRNCALPGILLVHVSWLAAAVLVAMRGDWLSIAVAFVVIGVVQYRIVMSCHEATHKTLLFPERLNEAVGLLHCSMVGINFIRYRRQHLAHHYAESIADDPDAYIYKPILAAPPGWRRAAVWLFGVLDEIVEKVRQKGPAASESGSVARTARNHSLAVIGVQIVLCAAFSASIGWWAYPLLWLAPLLSIALMLNRTRILVEHGVPHLALAPAAVGDAPQETVDILAGPIERFVIAPFAFNYHHAHHAIQSVPHYRNESLSRLLDGNAGGVSHRVRASYLGLLLRTLRHAPLEEDAFEPIATEVAHAAG